MGCGESEPEPERQEKEKTIDEQVLAIKNAKNRIRKRVNVMENQLKSDNEALEQCRMERNVARAKNIIRVRKAREKTHMTLLQMMSTLELQIIEIEQAEAVQDAYNGLKAARNVLDNYSKIASLDAIEALVDETKELVDDQNQVVNAMSTVMSPDEIQETEEEVARVLNEMWGGQADEVEESGQDAQQESDDERMAVPA